ncbi:MAG TPA: hypothetical protein VFK02_07840 [Kofleriaceae bacterium]|nr:hypothetical protein [Kofleriaceae bacterium]
MLQALDVPRFTLRSCLDGLVRRPWIVTLITVTCCAVLAARAASALLAASYLSPSADAPHASPPASRPAAPGPRHAGADELARRNMFCASCAPSAAAPGGELALPPAVLIETSLGREARATVHVLDSDVQGSWGLGDTIPGLGQVSHIAPRWIEVVDPAGRHGRLSLLELSPAPAAGRGPDTAISDGPPAAAWSSRIHRLGEQDYDVDRSLVRELVTGVAKADGVRAVPILEHGEIKGLRLFGVTPASIPAALGLRSGDALTAIDGEPIKNMQQLLDLYARLDQLSAVELSGTRAGKPLVRTLRLR